MSTLTVHATIPVVSTKLSRWAQRPNESLLECHNRRAKHNDANARSMAKRRAKDEQTTFNKAEAYLRQGNADFTRTLKDPAKHTSSVIPGATQTELAMRTHDADVAKFQALFQALPVRLRGTKRGDDIIASLTESFRPFSRTNKHKTPAWDVCSSRAMENLRIYNVMRANSPWKVSRSEPIPSVQRPAQRVPLYVDTRFETSDIEAKSPLLWQSSRDALHQATLTSRYNGLAHTCEATAKRIEADTVLVPYTPRTASVYTPVTLYASSALGRADGVYSIYPRVSDTHAR